MPGATRPCRCSRPAASSRPNSASDHIYIKGDATAAYARAFARGDPCRARGLLLQQRFFVIVDTIDATTPVEIDWLLHANEPYQLGKTSFRNTGEKAGFYGEVIWSEGRHAGADRRRPAFPASTRPKFEACRSAPA